MEVKMTDRKLFRCILVAYDGTAAADRIVDIAVTLAENVGARLIILGVIPPPSADAGAEGWGLEDEQTLRSRLAAAMTRFAAQANSLAVEIATEVVSGDPDATIEERARATDVDLVVVGHRTINRVRRWFEGRSTAEGLVSGAETSVLVIPEMDESV
jgi:nucleotide-binding universal stress UspA family protein